MSIEQLLLVGITTGAILVAVVLLRGRSGQTTEDASEGPELPLDDPPVPDTSDRPGSEAVQKLADTVGALRKLADLKDEEIERDNLQRSEHKVGWRPLAATMSHPRRRATDIPVGTRRPPVWTSTTDPTAATAGSLEMVLDPTVRMEPDSAERLRMRVGQAFSPAAPVARRDLFAGRTTQLESLVDVAFETGQHAIIYGERGVGKTSLAAILSVIFEDEAKKLAVRVNCDATDDFTSLWHKIIDELDIALDDGMEGSRALNAVRSAAEKTELTPNDVRRFLHQVSAERQCIILIDEFDTMTNEIVTRLFADTIKTLSDQLVAATLIIIGVADSLDDLLGEHGSINRAIVNIHMPRMSAEELKDTVSRGLQVLSMGIETEALDLIAHLSQGFPHVTHLLGQTAARVAIDGRRPLITIEDASIAVRRVADRVETWIEEAYERATLGSQDALYAEVLAAAALASADEKGSFTAADLREPLTAIMGKTYDIPSFTRQLNALADHDRGPVLARTGPERKHRYRFIEPDMEPYVLMRSLIAELIGRDLLATFAEGNSGRPPGDPASGDPAASRPARARRKPAAAGSSARSRRTRKT